MFYNHHTNKICVRHIVQARKGRIKIILNITMNSYRNEYIWVCENRSERTAFVHVISVRLKRKYVFSTYFLFWSARLIYCKKGPYGIVHGKKEYRTSIVETQHENQSYTQKYHKFSLLVRYSYFFWFWCTQKIDFFFSLKSKCSKLR